MIGITFALPAESAEMMRKAAGTRTRRENRTVVTFARISGREIAISHTGVGQNHCRPAVESFLEMTAPQVMISSGFAGSISGNLDVGDVVVAENFSDPVLADEVIQKIHRVRRVKLVTVDKMVDSGSDRAGIAREHSADAIDMETETIADVCRRRAVPMLSLRIVSDSPAAPFPAPGEILFDVEHQKTNFARLLPYLVTHPSAIGRLIRFTRQIVEVRASLADALIEVVTKLSLGENEPRRHVQH